jgi:hypothetical protein
MIGNSCVQKRCRIAEVISQKYIQTTVTGVMTAMLALRDHIVAVLSDAGYEVSTTARGG